MLSTWTVAAYLVSLELLVGEERLQEGGGELAPLVGDHGVAVTMSLISWANLSNNFKITAKPERKEC